MNCYRVYHKPLYLYILKYRHLEQQEEEGGVKKKAGG